MSVGSHNESSSDVGSESPGPKLMRAVLDGRCDGGVRTIVTNRAGNQLITDEPVSRGGTGSALSPLETVVGALCGCTSVTFERAAREADLTYTGIDYSAAYTLDRRGLLGEAPARPHYQTVQVEISVKTDATAEKLAEVVAVTEGRCPVRNLLVDAGVALVMKWSSTQA
jgi:putative redox protein